MVGLLNSTSVTLKGVFIILLKLDSLKDDQLREPVSYTQRNYVNMLSSAFVIMYAFFFFVRVHVDTDMWKLKRVERNAMLKLEKETQHYYVTCTCK